MQNACYPSVQHFIFLPSSIGVCKENVTTYLTCGWRKKFQL